MPLIFQRPLRIILFSCLFIFVLVYCSGSQKVSAQAQIADHFQFPLDIISNYSTTAGYDFLEVNAQGVFHPGEDWNANETSCDDDRGRVIYAIANGTVRYAANSGGFGNHVLIEHTLEDGSTIWSLYAHLDRIDVVDEQNVTIGTPIGTMGDSGTECVHLHFEIRIANLGPDYWPPTNDRDTVYNNYVHPYDFLVYSEITSGVALFQDTFFRGSRYEIRNVGFVNFPLVFNDKFSSIAIPHNWSVRVYKNADRGGTNLERKTFYWNHLNFVNYTFDDGSALNDNVSSADTYLNFCPAESSIVLNEVGDLYSCQVPTPTIQPTPPASGWNQFFYSDNSLGSQCGVRNESDVYMFRDSDGGWSLPTGCPSVEGSWSVRMERSDAWFDGGIYEFGLFYDDAARLYVDNMLVVDGWNATQHYESRNLTRGYHQLRLEYKNNAGHAIVQLWWRGPGALPFNNQTQDPNQWWTNYWGNQNQWQDAVGSQNEGTGFLDRNWATGGPGFGIPGDHFSMSFERTMIFDCGIYRFHLTSDDGSRLRLDGNIIPAFDHWNTNTWDTTADILMQGGSHTIKVDQFENGGGARVYLDWALISRCAPTPTPPPSPCPTIIDWKGEYWNNDSLLGSRSLCRNDLSVNFNWFAGSPDIVISDDHFSARWTRLVQFEEGLYTFKVTHDDGFRLYIDGSILFENWCSECQTTDRKTTMITPGTHEIILEYWENNGGSSIGLNWVPYKAGDANSDGKVDGIDYVIWLNHYNQNTSNGASDGDFNSDGRVDGIDYVIWLNNYDLN